MLDSPSTTPLIPNTFSDDELTRFERDGYAVVCGLGPEPLRRRMLEVTREGLSRLIEPIEYEADVQYPGSPPSRDVPGGRTVRRLKQALSRDYVFVEWLTFPPLVARLEQLLGPAFYCPLAHHNCIMTKHPAFSSDTGWHQDIRYWSFAEPELVTVWLSLGTEHPDNGCLRVIPGSHRMVLERERFDEALFLREDLAENQALIGQAQYVPLEAGDVLFFHCKTLHAATRNYTDQTKYSVVFTFRSADNPPRAGSRSAAFPELLIHGE